MTPLSLYSKTFWYTISSFFLKIWSLVFTLTLMMLIKLATPAINRTNITPAIVPYSPVSHWPVNKQVTLIFVEIYNNIHSVMLIWSNDYSSLNLGFFLFYSLTNSFINYFKGQKFVLISHHNLMKIVNWFNHLFADEKDQENL